MEGARGSDLTGMKRSDLTPKRVLLGAVGLEHIRKIAAEFFLRDDHLFVTIDDEGPGVALRIGKVLI